MRWRRGPRRRSRENNSPPYRDRRALAAQFGHRSLSRTDVGQTNHLAGSDQVRIGNAIATRKLKSRTARRLIAGVEVFRLKGAVRNREHGVASSNGVLLRRTHTRSRRGLCRRATGLQQRLLETRFGNTALIRTPG